MRDATLTYCTNVHPGETLAQVESSLDRFTVRVKRALAPAPFAADAPFPVGLYISAATTRELADPGRRARFRDFLAERGLAAATFNCFPFGGFHEASVKLAVYRPTWLDEARVEFTLAAARLLADLADGAPAGAPLAISTVAGSCKRFGDGPEVHVAIARNLGRVAAELARLEAATGREIVICLEPEPATTLETSGEAAAFFQRHLFGAAGQEGFRIGGGDAALARTKLQRHIGICFDTCHQAVEFEEAAAALATIDAAGIRIGKMQLSSALLVRDPADDPRRLTALARYAEPRYLHQAHVRRRDGRVEAFLDLPELLADPTRTLRDAAEVRVHFHVPIDRARLAPLETTRGFLQEAARVARRRGLTRTFEVETYTFPLLPDSTDDTDRPDLSDRLAPEESTGSSYPDAGLVAALAAELRFAAGLLDEPI